MSGGLTPAERCEAAAACAVLRRIGVRAVYFKPASAKLLGGGMHYLDEVDDTPLTPERRPGPGVYGPQMAAAS